MSTLRPGDHFRISTRSMCASGTITKVNRVTVAWAADVQWRPDGPIDHLTGTIPKHEFRGALIVRDGNAFCIIRP